jgi:hypothetical protein
MHSHYVLEGPFVETEIGNQTLQFPILFLETESRDLLLGNSR